jgi:hypothetical protein
LGFWRSGLAGCVQSLLVHLAEGTIPNEGAATDSCVPGRACKLVRRNGRTHASRVDAPLRNRDIPLSSGMATRVVLPSELSATPKLSGFHGGISPLVERDWAMALSIARLLMAQGVSGN